MEIAIAADHGGFQLKEKIRAHLIESGYTVKDFGCYSLESVDFPEYAAKVGHFVATENSLVCSVAEQGLECLWQPTK